MVWSGDEEDIPHLQCSGIRDGVMAEQAQEQLGAAKLEGENKRERRRMRNGSNGLH